MVYYRLKMIDVDQTFSYSEIVQVDYHFENGNTTMA